MQIANMISPNDINEDIVFDFFNSSFIILINFENGFYLVANLRLRETKFLLANRFSVI